MGSRRDRRPRAVEPLIAAFKDNSERVRAAAAEALDALAWSPDRSAVGAAYWAAKGEWHECAQIGAPAVEVLIAALAFKDNNERVRAAAAETLGEIGASAIELLIAAPKDQNEDVREAAVWALGRIGGACAVEALIDALTDREEFVRSAAAEALDALAWSPDRSEAGAAYWAAKGEWHECAQIGAPAVEPLIGALTLRDNNEHVRAAAAEALGTIGDARALAPLIAALKDEPADGGEPIKPGETHIGTRHEQDGHTEPRGSAMTEQAVPPSRTFRIFVSSTFSDLKAERDALQRFVFPRLRELCTRRGGRFQAIDLRWGVSEEAGLDQRTMSICLGEIERCQRTTPRPNFIVLLGERYGWRPLPADIPAEELTRIAAQVSDAEEKALLKTWYRLDENARPPVYSLQPRRLDVPETASEEAREEAQDAEATTWAATESRLREILLHAVAALGLDEEALLKYEASATEQEIVSGALRVPAAPEHVFCFFRTLTTSGGAPLAEKAPEDGSAGAFIDQIEADGRFALDVEAHRRLALLKEEKLRRLLGDNVHDYAATWSAESVGEDHLGALPDALEDCLALLDDPGARGTLCLDAWRSLATTILSQLEQVARIDPLSAEIWDHEEFGRERSGHFTGREQPLARIASYLAGSEPGLFAILGEPGSGKSALMAKALEEARAAHPEAVTLVRFIGATPASSDGRALLDALCREISRAYRVDESDVPSEHNDLAVELGKRMALAGAERPLILFLDALDQLSGVARSLSWLPGSLPEHVRVVLSTLPGDCEQALRAKYPAPGLVPLEAMSPEEGEKLLGLWLAQAGRTLQDHQKAEVLGKFAAEGLPLYLRLAFEEARLWPSYAAPEETDLSAGVSALIRENLFARLAQPANHGRVMVAHSLGYLAASRFGLSEEEIVDVLSLDDEVKSDFREHARRSPEIERLPIVVWSRFYFDLAPYLSERSAEGTTLLAFYHNQLREAASAAYLGGEHGPRRHAALAAYFRGRSDPAGERTWTGAYARGLSELPFHLAGAGELAELYETLIDFKFLEHKAAEVAVAEHADAAGKTTTIYAGVHQLLDDYELALAKLGGGPIAARKPMIVTAVDLGEGMVIRCPWCNEPATFREEWRGSDIECPNVDCMGPLRVNRFVVGESLLEQEG